MLEPFWVADRQLDPYSFSPGSDRDQRVGSTMARLVSPDGEEKERLTLDRQHRIRE